MFLPAHILFYLLLSASTILADSLVGIYPPPADLTSKDSSIPSVWKNLTGTFDSYLKKRTKSVNTAPLVGVENITFSVGLFSIHDPDAGKLQYHYTTPEIKRAKNGTNKVNGDSIYKLASASKLFTVYAGMLSLTEEEWNRPLSKINPRLAKQAANAKDDPIWHTDWDQITPWSLAAQISGIPREGWVVADALVNYTSEKSQGKKPLEDPVEAWGMPPFDLTTLGKYWNASDLCSGSELIDVLPEQPPAFLPWSTPMYANDNFMMLGLILSNLTGRPMKDIYQDEIFNPLNMASTFSSMPTNKSDLARSVIGDASASGFTLELPLSTPSGGLFSSTNDLAKFGISILNNTLLPPNTTRKWMKPVSHTASLTYSLGAPWEILRFVHESGKVTDLYTKLGDSGYCGSNIVLIPEYGAGFSIINAGSATLRGSYGNVIMDYVATTIIPTLEAQASLEAAKNFAGTHVASADSDLDSSVTIAFNKSTTGMENALSITKWISNGTDVLKTVYFGGVKPRLLPSIPKQTPDGEKGQVAFQASLVRQKGSYQVPGAAKLGVLGPFTGQYKTNYDWLNTDGVHYAGRGLNLLVFDVDGEGKASAVTPAAARVHLERKK